MLAYRRTALRRRVLVNTKTDRTFSGVLIAQRGPLLILKGAAMLNPTGQPSTIDGDLVLERSNVDFVQVLPSAEG